MSHRDFFGRIFVHGSKKISVRLFRAPAPFPYLDNPSARSHVYVGVILAANSRVLWYRRAKKWIGEVTPPSGHKDSGGSGLGTLTCVSRAANVMSCQKSPMYATSRESNKVEVIERLKAGNWNQRYRMRGALRRQGASLALNCLQHQDRAGAVAGSFSRNITMSELC